MKSVISPVSSADRIALLDILRGFALFGILMVNMQIFFRPLTVMMAGHSGTGGFVENMPEIFIKFFFEGKFYILFSLLFGYGFWMFINKPASGTGIVIPLFRRRLLILLLLGIAHVVFIWAGDILVFYALFGFILLLLRKKSSRKLIRWAVWLALVPFMLSAIMYLMFLLGSLHPESAGEIQQSITERAESLTEFIAHASGIYAEGTFLEIMRVRLQEYLMLLPGIFFFYPVVLGMFLIGFVAARKKLITNFKDNILFFRRAFWWGMAIGIPSSALYTFSYFRGDPFSVNIWAVVTSVTMVAGGFFMCLFYVSVIVLLYNSSRNRPFKYLAFAGRMALTNYLLQSVICTTLFLSYGFGLFGQISTFQGIVITIIIFGLQIPFSLLWLKKFQYGPAEWLWRSLTYRKWQPFKRKSTADKQPELTPLQTR